MRSSIDTPCRSNAGRLGDEGLRRRVPLAGNVALFDGPLLDGPDRLPGLAIEHVEPACLVGWMTALISLPLTVMSARIGAQGMSKSQIPWCTSW